MFLQTSIREVTQASTEYDSAKKSATTWYVTISNNGSPLSIKMDTGTEVTAFF